MAGSAPSIEIHALRKEFAGKAVLDRVDLSVAPGEVLGYIGPNGAGKTTTVKILIGMLGGYTGVVRVAGFDPRLHPIEVKRRIGYVPENAALYEALTVDEFLEFVSSLHAGGVAPRRTGAAVSRILQAFDLADRRHARIGSLSKGMRQKVLITSALLHDPEIVFLDEPLSGLDVASTILIKELVRSLADAGKTIFYCSHMMDIVERVCDRIAILHDGRIAALGTFEELAERSAAGSGGSLERVFVELTRAGDAAERAARILAAIRDA